MCWPSPYIYQDLSVLRLCQLLTLLHCVSYLPWLVTHFNYDALNVYLHLEILSSEALTSQSLLI